MRTKPLAILIVAALLASPLHAGTWSGTLKLGGIVIDEEGDFSAVQETFNLYDGFSVTQIRLEGAPNPQNNFMLDLREINLDGRRGDFHYRRPGALKVSASFDQSRQVFDPVRSVTSERKDWNVGARFTPARWLTLSGSFNNLSRDGDRLAYPTGTAGALGSGYDYALRTARVAAEARKGRRGVAVSYRISDFSDELNSAADRTGRVVSARVFGPCALYDKWTHLVRGSYGVSEVSGTLTNPDVDYKLYTIQYTGVVRPLRQFDFRYTFDAQRVDNSSTDLKTDRIRNAFDATVYHRYGSVMAGYGYETNDDDRSLTSNHRWRAAATLRYDRYVTAKVRYSGRVKSDLEELTLLKDIESVRVGVDLEVRPVTDLAVGGGFSSRSREFPDIAVESEGESFRGYARYTYAGWAGLSVDYVHSKDEYDDLFDGFDTESDVVTGRVDFEQIQNLRLSGALTYIDAGKDLDIEKSIVSIEGRYSLLDDWHLEAKYNVFNYDDYILLDRYYTGNVLWFNIAYDFLVD